MTPGRSIAAFAGGVAIALALVSCGERTVGTGVVLWSDGGPLATGALVDVVEESTIEDRYLVRAASADRSQDPVPVAPRWRVRVFADPEQAAAFAARYADFVDVYAYAARRGLPVRAQASATAGIVYKLREQEVTKVLERGAEPEQVGSFENYWYQVLTEDGTEGFTFGEFLPRFESTGDPRADAVRLHTADPGLERVVGTAWRPEEYLSMVRRRRFDLLRLRPEYGLFPDPEAGVFRLVTAQREREFPYREIERVGDDRYVLAEAGGGGSPARFTVRGNGALAFSYVDEGRLITEVFVDLQADVEELIAAERARRERLFANLLRRGPLLRSGGYGTIELTAEGRFRWQGYEALVPRWVPDGLPGTGVVDFRYALGAPLRGSYDVAVTLLFDGPESAAGADPAAGAGGDAGSGAVAGAAPGAAAVAGGAGGGAAAARDGAAAGANAASGADGAAGAGVGASAGASAPARPGSGGAAGAGTAGGTGAGDTTTGAGAAATGAGDTTAGADAAATGAGDTTTGAGAAATGAGDTTTGAGAAATGAGDTTARAGVAATGAGDTTTGAGAAATGAGDTTTGTGAAATGTAAAGAAGTAAVGAVGTDTGAAATGTAGIGATGVGTAAAGTAGTGTSAAGTGAGAARAADSEPEYPRPLQWAAELTLLVSYDDDGIRLTPAEPDAAALEVRQVNRSAVVMYFASSTAGDG